ncbi:MAG: T9SS type A sorting domain-containing protein, partial [Bacteroidia bacterium]
YLLSATVSCLIVNSYNAGPGANGWDCTGAETGLGNPKGCTGNGCHSSSATAGINVALELDSAGIPTSYYKGGMNYTIKITGTNTTTTSLPRFGFQIATIVGSSAQTTPVATGSWKTPYPTGTHFAAAQPQNMAICVVEHGSALSPSTGTGGNGTTYTRTFNWAAPAAGTGVISIWGVLNAVNGNSNADAGDHWNTKNISINEWPANAGIASPVVNRFSFHVFPNPVSTLLNMEYFLNENGNVSVKLLDLQGNEVAVLFNETQSSGPQSLSLPLSSDLHEGIYLLNTIINNEQIVRKIIVSR